MMKKMQKKTETVDKWTWTRVNSNVAIWSRDKSEIKDEEYQAFFKATGKEDGDALTWIHFKAEGEVEFKSILFVPTEVQGLYDNYSDRKAGIRLYVRKVLIQDDFEDLLPKYLNFIRGVVDSDDLPLNVSRETLQHHKVLKVMGKKLVRKALEMLRKLSDGTSNSEDDDDDDNNEAEKEDAIAKDDENHPYFKFWKAFGKSIKMGVIEDHANRSKLAKLLRFQSSARKFISLEDYVENMPEWQTDIYFIAGESVESVKKSPFLEVATKKNIEVLFLTEPVDEYVFQHMADFDGHKLQSLTKEGLKFSDEDENTIKKRSKIYKESFKPLTKYLKTLLEGKVSKVTVSQRVETTPSVIVTSQYGHTANMERIMRAQTFANVEGQKAMAATRSLELNPRHPIIIELRNKVVSNPDDESTKDLGFLLYSTALLSSGFPEDDLESFSDRMYRTMGASLNVKSMALEDEIEVSDDDEEEVAQESMPESSEGHDEF